MNKKQKIALILFAFIDVIIIVIFARTIMTGISSYRAPLLQSPEFKCADYFLETLQTDNRQVTFSMTKNTLNLSVSVKSPQVLDDASLLWSLLEEIGQIAPKAHELCQKPQSLSLQLNILRDNLTTSHFSIIEFEDLVSWSQDKVSEDQFAAQIKYRQVALIPD